MVQTLLHVFRNNPYGRETFRQSLYFSGRMGLSLRVYIPRHSKFLMYFENEVVQVDLDSSYLSDPDTAEAHVLDLARSESRDVDFYVPRDFTASTLPDVPVSYDFMCCPRSMSDLASRIGLGYVGPRVRKIAMAARFPVLVPSQCYTPWDSISVFFGGSVNAFKSLGLGLLIKERTGMPLDLYTLVEPGVDRESMEKLAQERGMAEAITKEVRDWRFFETGKLEDCLYDVPPQSLAVLGAYGHGIIRQALFGSKMEIIQSQIVNSLLIVGPNCRPF